MEQTYLDCLNCQKQTKHAVFTDDFKLPKSTYLTQCYECETMTMQKVRVENA